MKGAGKPRLRLGVTGGIGSGKSSVCKVFNVLGIPVFYSDPEAKAIMNNDLSVRSEINAIAGRDLYLSGNLDRAELAKLIFNDDELLGRVNALIHPLVFQNFLQWADMQAAPYVIMEAAILFESGAYEIVDKVLTVVAPLDQRIDRIVKGNQLTREQVMDRIRNQMDDDDKVKNSDYIIYNSEDDMIIPPVLRIHKDLLRQIGLND
ncbi:MAG: dephospho-CoA kinase [Bacteroidales bacterium]|jgi:dephospho-CoA kinase|nr:dephospho-CoA kinase [Bacteroidales bacterium]